MLGKEVEMTRKRISVHASEETVQRIASLAKLDQRSASKIADAALDFYLRLPSYARDALRHVKALGTDEDQDRVISRISHVLLDARHQITERETAGQLPNAELDMPEPARFMTRIP
jgi:hypothetical protein